MISSWSGGCDARFFGAAGPGPGCGTVGVLWGQGLPPGWTGRGACINGWFFVMRAVEAPPRAGTVR